MRQTSSARTSHSGTASRSLIPGHCALTVALDISPNQEYNIEQIFYFCTRAHSASLRGPRSRSGFRRCASGPHVVKWRVRELAIRNSPFVRQGDSLALRKEYTEADIQVLEYPENIQRRPGMYVGGKGASALHHLAIEVIDNAVDEALAGACDRIEVVIRADGTIAVSDNGRGIPIGMHPEKDKPTLEVAFTELHSGGKFEEGSYSTAGGLHGVGIKATNALSTWLVVTVKRDGVLYRQRYERGLPVTPVQILDPHTEEVIGQVGVRGETDGDARSTRTGASALGTHRRLYAQPRVPGRDRVRLRHARPPAADRGVPGARASPCASPTTGQAAPSGRSASTATRVG